MKRHIATAINALIKPFGVKIIRAGSHTFDMASAVRRIKAHDIPIATVIDIGASNGKWSIDAMRTFPKASFIAVEPLVEQKEALDGLSRRLSNFDYVLCVAGDTDHGEVSLSVTTDIDGSTVDGVDGEKRVVPTRTIDSIVTEKNLNGPFLLKFDTHGYELPILSGAVNTLRRTSVIIMETYNFKITRHSLEFYQMCSHMEQLGFHCFDLSDLLLRPYDNVLWQMDILFCKTSMKLFSYKKFI